MKTVGLRVLRYIAILIIPWWNHKSAASLWQVFEPIDRSTGQVNFLLLIICCVVLYTLLAEYQNELEICQDMEPMVLTRVKKRTEELLALLIKPAIKRTMLFCMMVTAFSVINLSGMSRLPELILALGLTIILWDLCALLLYLFGVGRKISLFLLFTILLVLTLISPQWEVASLLLVPDYQANLWRWIAIKSLSIGFLLLLCGMKLKSYESMGGKSND